MLASSLTPDVSFLIGVRMTSAVPSKGLVGANSGEVSSASEGHFSSTRLRVTYDRGDHCSCYININYMRETIKRNGTKQHGQQNNIQ